MKNIEIVQCARLPGLSCTNNLYDNLKIIKARKEILIQYGHTGKRDKDIQWPLPIQVYLQSLDIRISFK